MTDCIFCKIVNGEIPAEFEAQTANLVVIKDIHPQAPVHLLIIPKKHLRDIREASADIWSEVKTVVLELSKKMEISDFRLVHNVGSAAGVAHMHIHFLGGITADRNL